jgi:hypothetical protein
MQVSPIAAEKSYQAFETPIDQFDTRASERSSDESKFWVDHSNAQRKVFTRLDSGSDQKVVQSKNHQTNKITLTGKSVRKSGQMRRMLDRTDPYRERKDTHLSINPNQISNQNFQKKSPSIIDKSLVQAEMVKSFKLDSQQSKQKFVPPTPDTQPIVHNENSINTSNGVKLPGFKVELSMLEKVREQIQTPRKNVRSQNKVKHMILTENDEAIVRHKLA